MNIYLQMALAHMFRELAPRLPAPPASFRPGRFSGVAAAKRLAQKRRNQQRARHD
jgi:hypothetical protein